MAAELIGTLRQEVKVGSAALCCVLPCLEAITVCMRSYCPGSAAFLQDRGSVFRWSNPRDAHAVFHICQMIAPALRACCICHCTFGASSVTCAGWITPSLPPLSRGRRLEIVWWFLVPLIVPTLFASLLCSHCFKVLRPPGIDLSILGRISKVGVSFGCPLSRRVAQNAHGVIREAPDQ